MSKPFFHVGKVPTSFSGVETRVLAWCHVIKIMRYFTAQPVPIYSLFMFQCVSKTTQWVFNIWMCFCFIWSSYCFYYFQMCGFCVLWSHNFECVLTPWCWCGYECAYTRFRRKYFVSKNSPPSTVSHLHNNFILELRA